MTNIVLQADNIKKYFKTKKNKEQFKAVDGISFKVHAGEIVSFVGPNGAGKTTLIKCISNYLVPNVGSVSIMGLDLSKNTMLARRKLGVVFGGDLGFYNAASARDNLEFFARILDVPEKNIKHNVEHALEIVELQDVAQNNVRSFSKGMLQRLHIARGIVNDPQILLLDEPTAGLDVESVMIIRNFIKKLAVNNKGIILTSHNMSDIETLADKLFLIGAGKIYASGSIDEIKRLAGEDSSISLEQTYLKIADKLKRNYNATN